MEQGLHLFKLTYDLLEVFAGTLVWRFMYIFVFAEGNRGTTNEE